MKLIVGTLLVFIAGSAAAQGAKDAEMDMAFVEPPPPQVGQILIPASDFFSHSSTGVIAINSIPDAPTPIPMTASIRAISSSRSQDFKTFRSDRFNRMLVANEFSARGLDAFSTYKRLNDPCGCFSEGSRPFGFNMTPAFESVAGVYAYSFGVAAAYSYISAKLWDTSKTHPRHGRLLRTLSRGLLIGDSAMEFTAAVHNLTITKPRFMVR